MTSMNSNMQRKITQMDVYSIVQKMTTHDYKHGWI